MIGDNPYIRYKTPEEQAESDRLIEAVGGVVAGVFYFVVSVAVIAAIFAVVFRLTQHLI